jgi:predicted glutamine amidotransferase
LHTQRSLLPAHRDNAFREFAEQRATRSAIVHLRLGTPGYGEGPDNTHPFVAGPQAFAHNGAIGPRAKIDLLVRGDLGRVSGRTDSERYFLAVRDEMADGADLAEAVRRVLDRMAEHGLVGNSLNALLLGPDSVQVIAEHDGQWEPGTIPVWPADDLSSGLTLPRYLPLAYRTRPDQVAVVSSGIVGDGPGDGSEWVLLPNHEVLSVDLQTREQRLTVIDVESVGSVRSVGSVASVGTVVGE